MNSMGYHAPHCAAPEQIDWSFSLLGPLPAIGADEQYDYFTESETAHDQYTAHRSMNAAANAVTYHVVDDSGEVAGFIVFRIANEDGRASTRIFSSVEYIYVKQKLRGRGLSKLLLEPLLQDMRVVLDQVTGVHRKLMVRVYSSSSPESAGENRVVRYLEERLLEITKRYRRVELIGRYVSGGASARQCAWKASRDMQ
jgi:GNAT superfamily N-acetyltransferase